MSITQMSQSVPGSFPVAERDDPAGAAAWLLRCLGDVEASVDAVQAGLAGPTRVPVDRQSVERVTRVSRRLEAVRVRMVALAEARGLPEHHGFVDTGSWFSATTRTDRRAAAGEAKLGSDLAEADREAALAATAAAATCGGGGVTGGGAEADGGGAGAAVNDAGSAAGNSTAGGGGSSSIGTGVTARSRTSAALDAGDLSVQHAEVILRALRALPTELTASERAACEAELVRLAGKLTPARLRRAAERVLAAIKPREPEAVDAHQDAVVAQREEQAWQKASFWLKDNQDGTMTGQFTVPWLSGAMLKKIVDAMTAPRRRPHGAGGPSGGRGSVDSHGTSGAPGGHHDGTAGPAGRAFTSATGWGSGHESTGWGSGREQATHESVTRENATPETSGRSWRFDQEDWQRRRGVAFAELLQHLPTDHLHGKTAATVVVTTPLEALRHEVIRAGLTDAGEAISAAETRRLACGAGVMPAVLGGRSVPIDLGRQERCFTANQKTALATRYTECAADGCDRPFAWTEIHHIRAWARGGSTDLNNAVPLCGTHHRWVERSDIRHEIRRRSDHTIEIGFHRRS